MSVQGYSYLLFLLLLWLSARLARRPGSRQALYLAASLLFYAAWGLAAVCILSLSAVFNYAWGRLLRRTPRRLLLWSGIGVNLALLAVFKYVPWAGIPVSGALPGVLHSANPFFLVGISFWTFQALGYLIDVYHRRALEVSFLEVWLYLVFWPTVLAGPIHRIGQIVPQLRRVAPPAWEDLAAGAGRILRGLFMKVVLADVISAGLRPGEGLVDGLLKMTAPGSLLSAGLGGLDAWFLALGFGFVLYFDFAGYSDIVIGSGRLFGLRLVENFDRPYCAANPSQFWGRWHISLSAWIREYVFLPLARQRRGRIWRSAVLIFTMLLFGLWHGARLTFLLWGLYHGVLLALYHAFQAARQPVERQRFAGLRTLVSWAVTFALVTPGWILFFSPDLPQAAGLLAALFSPGSYFHLELPRNYYLVVTLISAGYFLRTAWQSTWRRRPLPLSWQRLAWLFSPLYDAALIVLILLWNDTNTAFIYFQF